MTFLDNNTLLSLVRCPHCAHEGLGGAMEKVQCLFCKKEYRSNGKAIFFSGEPDDARRLVDAPPNKRRWSFSRWRIFDYFRTELKAIPQDAAVCDVGIGTAPFHELTDRFTTMVGVDFFPYAPVQVVADITKPLPLRDNVFDVVICSEVLEHIPNPTLLIGEMARVVKQGGMCIGSVPFLHAIHYAPYDFFRYTPFALTKLFKDAGFDTIEVVAIGTPADVYKVFQDRFFTAHVLPMRSSKHVMVNNLLSLALRVARKVHSILFSIFWPLYRRIPSSPEWALAYCFKATKRHNLLKSS